MQASTRARTGWPALLAAFILLPPAVAVSQAGPRSGGSDQGAGVERAAFEVYAGPKRRDVKIPRYPSEARYQLAEGWVHTQFMVDTQGMPYEIVVTDAIGHGSFRRAAVRALEQSTFEPAHLDGRPLDAGYRLKFKFALEGRQHAKRSVKASYDRLRRLVGEGDRAGADEALARIDEGLAKRNLYEDAWLHVAKYAYYQKWGTPRQQLAALDRAIAHEEGAAFLPEAMFRVAQTKRFHLLVSLNRFAAALGAFESLEKLADHGQDEGLRNLQPIVDRILALKHDDRAYGVHGELDDYGRWHHRLFKDDFSFLEVQGRLAELKLRCDRGFVFFRYDDKLEYHVAEDQGECSLTVLGNAGTTFVLGER